MGLRGWFLLTHSRSQVFNIGEKEYSFQHLAQAAPASARVLPEEVPRGRLLLSTCLNVTLLKALYGLF